MLICMRISIVVVGVTIESSFLISHDSPCLVGLLALVLAFGPKSQKPNQRGCFWMVLFQKQLFFRSSFLKAGLTLLLAFCFSKLVE